MHDPLPPVITRQYCFVGFPVFGIYADLRPASPRQLGLSMLTLIPPLTEHDLSTGKCEGQQRRREMRTDGDGPWKTLA
jgi:hypothetical protein